MRDLTHAPELPAPVDEAPRLEAAQPAMAAVPVLAPPTGALPPDQGLLAAFAAPAAPALQDFRNPVAGEIPFADLPYDFRDLLWQHVENELGETAVDPVTLPVHLVGFEGLKGWAKYWGLNPDDRGEEHVAYMVEDMKGGSLFPPILQFEDGQLMDGRHRLFACMELEISRGPALVFEEVLDRFREASGMPVEPRAPIGRQTDSQRFKDWFGKSQVVDENGEPRKLFHGTQKVFESFTPISYFSEHPDEANGYALAGERLHTARAMARRYQFVPAEGLDIKDTYLVGECMPCLQDYEGPDHVVFPVEDGLAYKVKGRYRIVMDRKLDSDSAVLDARAADLHPYERMAMVRELPCFVRQGCSEMETRLREDIQEAEKACAQESPAVIPVYVSMQNPYRTESDTYAAQFINFEPTPGAVPMVDVPTEVARLKSLGYDGIIAPSDGVRIANLFGEGPGHDVLNYIVFEPTQVKSATGNSGAFDPTNPDLKA